MPTPDPELSDAPNSTVQVEPPAHTTTPAATKAQARRGDWLWYGFCLLALAAAVFWAQRVVTEMANDEQRAIVPVSTVWGMHACLALGLIALGALLGPLGRLLGHRHLAIGMGLAVLGYLACGLAPKTTRIFYDEHIYMQIGQTIAHTGRAEYARHATAEYGDFKVFAAAPNKQPNGHPYLLSWAYKLGGVSAQTSHATIRAVVGLTAAAVYFALVLAPFALPAFTPLAAALGFVFTPLVLWWGNSVAVEPTTVGTAAACFLAVCLHARLRNLDTGESSPLTGLLVAATAAFAAYFRPESLLIYPVAASLLWAADRRFLEDRVTWAALALSVALITPNLLHLWSVRTEDWGATDGRRFDVAFIGKNLASNAGYFFQQNWYPLAGSVLALIGAGWLAVRNRWLGLSLGLWFAMSWGIFVLFYAGGYYYGASSRYALVSAIPVALLAGIGAAALIALLRPYRLALSAVGVLAGLNWLSAMSYVPTLGRESNEARADIDFCAEVAPTLPTGSLVVSIDPCIWNVLGRNAAHIDTIQPALRNEMLALVNQYPGGIYLHWDYWMNCEPQFAAVLRKLIDDTQATLFVRKNAEAVQFALFRLDTPHARKIFGGGAVIHHKSITVDEVLAGPGAVSSPPTAAAPAPVTTPAAEPTP